MKSDRRRLAVLGSTGSIGRQTLDVVRAYPDRFEVVALAARGNVDSLAEQAREFRPALTVLTGDDPAALQRLREALPDRLATLSGEQGLTTAATLPDVDMVVAATSGLVGVLPTIAAIRAGKDIALANKETLVMAGHLVMAEAKQAGVAILPVDSEHNALWQCLRGEDRASVRRLLITASGGPFRQLSLAEMREMSPEQALNHPTWRMGPKITIDSATLMNKGLEVIEAHWLYDMPYERIAVVVHPQSIIHSMVEYVDDSIKMQASIPSMHLPIQYALSYPDRLDRAGTALSLPLRWNEVAKLEFESADLERFPCLRLAFEAGAAGGSAPAVLVGADETAVELFLRGAIRFTDIAEIVGETLQHHNVIASPGVEEVGAVSVWAQEEARRVAERLTGATRPAATAER
ncbi:MAG TPA: 1-deoxy-D-xylulose-5-phosphate reductoisomerase [Ktedonobacterales bacterium]|nr:1-deoxy-D-xylulose-5-phosphate reductoisomerase [Ktedonobacterales bacterium]